MVTLLLAISVGQDIHYFLPKEDYNHICDFLTERVGWCREDAEKVACWAQMADYEDFYETTDKNVEIYFALGLSKRKKEREG